MASGVFMEPTNCTGLVTISGAFTRSRNSGRPISTAITPGLRIRFFALNFVSPSLPRFMTHAPWVKQNTWNMMTPAEQ